MPVGSYALLKVKATPAMVLRRFFDFISETYVYVEFLNVFIILPIIEFLCP